MKYNRLDMDISGKELKFSIYVDNTEKHPGPTHILSFYPKYSTYYPQGKVEEYKLKLKRHALKCITIDYERVKKVYEKAKVTLGETHDRHN